MTAARLSRNGRFPGGFFRFDERGDVTEHVPFPAPRDPLTDGWQAFRLAITDGTLRLSIDGQPLGSLPVAAGREGHFGFRGSGWNRAPVCVRNIRMTFADPGRPGSEWVEKETFGRPSLTGRMLFPALGLGVLLAAARGCRTRAFAAGVRPSRATAFRLVSSAGFLLCLAIAAARPTARGMLIPLAFLAAEWLDLPALLAWGGQPDSVGAAGARRAGAALLLLFAGASIATGMRHGGWAARRQHATAAKRDNPELAALIVAPDAAASSPAWSSGPPREIRAGAPLFAEGHAYREQRIEAVFEAAPETTLDVAFQQQSFRTRGDPAGEALPLQRRLLRLSSVPGVGTGLALRTDNRPRPWRPLDGALRTGITNSLAIESDAGGIRVTLNGRSTVFDEARPIGFGETGLMVQEGQVTVRRFAVTPLPSQVIRERLRPLAAPVVPFAVLLLFLALWRLAGAGAARDLLPLELAALFPLAAYAAMTLALPTDTLAALGRVRLAWLDVFLAAAAFSHLLIVVLARGRLHAPALAANLVSIAGVACLALLAWDRLPAEHPLRVRFAGDGVAPAASEGAEPADGRWYDRNRLVGAQTFVWRQQLGGESLPPRKEPGVRRIFVVGGSQAWGSGAADSRHTFAALLEDSLRARGLAVEVFNAAANGAGVEHAMHLYEALLRNLEPDVIVADVGLNECTGLLQYRDDGARDEAAAGVAGFLDRLIRGCRRDGVAFLLVLEPMCGETPLRPVESFYGALAATAAAHGAPVVDPAAELGEKETLHQVWWDTAHLTPYGHRVMADILRPHVEALARKATGPGQPNEFSGSSAISNQ
jgi:hypothetical protein